MTSISDITEYRADFFLGDASLSFSVDTEPEKDSDASIPPLRVHGAYVQDNGATYVRWCRDELEPYIGEHVISPFKPAQDALVICTLSAEGDILLDVSTAMPTRVEAFAVNRIGGVKVGVFSTILGKPTHEVIVLDSTPNYVLERLSFRLSSRVALFDSVAKRRGNRKKLNP